MDPHPRTTMPPLQRQIVWLDRDAERSPAAGTQDDVDPGDIMLTCASCGARMDERKCKLICRCGYFLSCSDYY